MGNGIGSSFTVGYNQATRAEIHTAIIAHHDNENVGEFIGIDLSENRLSGSTRRFTVIIGAKLRTCGTQHISIAYVAGIVVFLAIPGNQLLYRLHALYVMGKSEELNRYEALAQTMWPSAA